jgi:tetratricopeptide (TPR) repeat protein
VAEVKQWCHHRQGRWLFVFDSADDIDDSQSPAYIDLQRVVIDVPTADVIITTRCQSAKEMTNLEAVQVAELTPTEARDLFLRRSKLPAPSGEVCEEVDAIAEELGFFALAINLAAAYVAETPRLRRHPGAYLNEYRQRRKALLDRKPKAHVDQYGASVLSTWETSYTAMFDRCPQACNLLIFMAFLSPDDLFFELLQADDQTIINFHATWLLMGTSSASVQEVLDSSLAALRSYSLLLWRDERSSYSMHKLVHAWSFDRSDITSKAQFCTTALNFLDCFIRVVTEEPSRGARMVSHIMTCFARAREVYAAGVVDEVGIVDRLGFLAGFLQDVGEMDRAYELYAFIHDHYRRTDCSHQDKYFESSARLGNAMFSKGRWEDLVGLLRPALAQYREAHGSDHRSAIGVGITLVLGRALDRLGESTEAVLLLRRALGECETPLERLLTMRSLALVLSYTDSKKEAVELSGQAVDGLQRLVGWTSRDTLYALVDYVEVLMTSGQFEKAKTLSRQALRVSEATFGPQNPNTMVCMAQCGRTSRLLGDFEEANRLLHLALSGLETTLGMDNTDTLDCVCDLACCLQGQGSYIEALALFQRASDGRAANLGVHHPFAVHCASEVADLRSFLQERAALHEALKQVNARFSENLQAGQHLWGPLRFRSRALTYPGGSFCNTSRLDRDLIQQEGSDDGEGSAVETVSDSGWDVAEVYGRR